MKKGLRENFLFPTVCLILIGLAVTSYVSYRNARVMMVDSVNDQLRQNTESILDFVVSWSENRRRDVALVGQPEQRRAGNRHSGLSH